MPVVKKFKGEVVSKLRETHDGRLRLTLANTRAGDYHRHLVVTQEEWRLYGRSVFVPSRQVKANCTQAGGAT